jgi:hypothetical protein
MEMTRIWTEELSIIEKSADSIELEILGLPFYGPFQGKDYHREFLTPRTHTEKAIGDSIPTSYFHGRTPEGKRDKTPEFFGKAVLVRWDERGGWFTSKIELAKKHGVRIAKAAHDGILRASTGLAGTLHRVLPTGELTLWVPGELALIDQKFAKQPSGGVPRIAANSLAVAMPVLKSLYAEAGIDWPLVLQKEERPGSIRIALKGKEIVKVRLKNE